MRKNTKQKASHKKNASTGVKLFVFITNLEGLKDLQGLY
jgi:hypothetical protein